MIAAQAVEGGDRPARKVGGCQETQDGVLAGSVIGLDAGVRNLAAFAGIPPDEAAMAATTVPRRLLGLSA